MFFVRHPFLVFFLFSLSEAILLANVGTKIGWGWTILAIVSTAMIGSAMWRQQGLETWRRVNQRMAQGELPGSELIEGVMLIVGGALLITPGFITDTIGFLLLFPVSRKAAAKWLFAKGVLQSMSQRGGFQQGGFSGVYGSGEFGRGGNEKVWVYQQYSSTNQRFEDADRVTQDGSQEQAESSSQTDDNGVIEGEFIPKDKS
ncbi:MAG: FxsA family protein [Pseudomonadales bacterium]|nr:FxsA family protein [Pseudomonadales bacterium]